MDVCTDKALYSMDSTLGRRRAAQCLLVRVAWTWRDGVRTVRSWHNGMRALADVGKWMGPCTGVADMWIRIGQAWEWAVSVVVPQD